MALLLFGKHKGENWYFRQDANANLIPLSDDEMVALRKEMQDEHDQRACDIFNDTTFWDQRKM